MPSIHLGAILITVVMASWLHRTSTEIFTSSLKVHRMVAEEDRLLDELKRYIDVQYSRLKFLSNFYIDRLQEVNLRRKTDLDLTHPNAVYKVIKRFASAYSPLMNEKLEHIHLTRTRTFETFQNIYNMSALDMTRGDYLGYQGPQLQAVDAYEIGQNGNAELARELFEEARILGNKPSSAQAFCRYREALLPYYRFQEEILSVDPFASVIYHVITDQEGDHMKSFVRNKLKRGKVGSGKAIVSDIRTSDIAWIYDKDSPHAASVARRIECITGLDTSQREPQGPHSGEPFQVVNYGLGGHYSVHMDPFG
ncbi:unnamed protein product, partial [Candidula unifasciata]